MSDDDPSRSPTPPVGPPEAMPPILSFAEKQEVSTHPLASIHIPTSRPHFTSALQCPCPLGIHACVPALGYLGQTHHLRELAPTGSPLRVPALNSWAYTNKAGARWARRFVSLPLDILGIHTLSESWRPMGSPLRVPAPGYLGHTHHRGEDDSGRT